MNPEAIPAKVESSQPGPQNWDWATGSHRSGGHPHLGGEDVALRSVDADGDLGAGGAELLEEAAIGADPQVVLGDLHLR